MKETRFFFVPDAASQTELPPDEAMHAMRVLRLKGGDELFLMDGEGTFYRAEVTIAATHHCYYQIKEAMPQQPQWKGHLHLAIAPTKMLERIEWMTEKATEIGIDEISFFTCQFSERRVMKTTRLEKIAISAVKQSHKAWKPVLHELVSFRRFLETPVEGRKYIAHCYDTIPRTNLFDELRKPSENPDATVLVGPEGDFSIEEVEAAIAAGYTSVDLGQSRMRTETAGLAAVMMMQLSQQ
ncbi:MAG: 16S rRNA (uracil(1498)-N(3))-methyltransferase [Prevotella sp.]|nr:16S rRNA (uracil(1498)-N(3))-methyltransferase [Prevotella sp.]MEE3446398.1 16S rRNA (uracil(1498)-N(3))-methyltransferase [Prevotella sp.]